MKRGFSLVELSIVLVILGLLTGGILAGQSLIRASELRSISADFQRYIAATHTFRDKYMGLPGDLRTAINFWGDDVAACTDGNAANNGTPGTCNGDGNGQVLQGGGGATAEPAQYWKQLALAGLIEGSYTGIAGAGSGYHAVIGTNAPRSRIPTAGFSVWWWGAYLGNANIFDGGYGNMMGFGTACANSVAECPAIKPEEAWNVDTKMDDGKPATGNVRQRTIASAVAPDCITTDTPSTSTYKFTVTTNACPLLFVTNY